MKLFAGFLILSVVPLLAACGQTGRAADGAGYEVLKPASATRTYITQNDPQFTDQVAAHNIQCRKDQACRK